MNGVISKKSMGQIEGSSPAQIWAEAADLATLIFGSNSAAIAWSVCYCENNAESDDFASSEGFKLPGSELTHAHTHAHTH